MLDEVLGSQRLRNALLIANGLITLLVLYVFRKPHGGDMLDYLALADGILQGNYSIWHRMPVEIPDTFRNPGYPLFLALFRVFTKELFVIQLAQMAMYVAAVLIMLRTISKLGGMIAGNLFLLLLIPSINMAYFASGLYPETPVLFLGSLFLWADVVLPRGWARSVLMGLCIGAAFQCRSTLLLFPVFHELVTLFLERPRPDLRRSLIFLATFIITLMPYSLWNLKHHGVLRPTPLEGGGGVMYLGWWSGKVPGHKEWWYWKNFFSNEPISFTDDVPGNIRAFDAECHQMDSLLRPFLTAKDSLMIAALQPYGTKTYNTRYTLERERLLKKITLQHIKEEPGYTLRTKAYTAIRLWITGYDPYRLGAASIKGKVAELYPFVLTATIFLMAIIAIPLAMYRDRAWARRCMPLILWIVYFGAIHIPFAIQGRYVIPARLALLALLALALEHALLRRSGGARTTDPKAP